MSEEEHIPCFRCGTCCIAPDISTLRKPLGVPCGHLRTDHLCGIYPDRPPVCRAYQPDDICLALQQLPEHERVHFFLTVYDLLDEAARVGDDAVGARQSSAADEQ